MTTTPSASIVVGVDGSHLSDTALRWAAAEAERTGAGLHVMHLVAGFPAVPGIGIVDFGEPEQLAGHVLEEAVGKVRAEYPDVAVTGQVLMGPAAPVLVEMSRQAALVVVGARGHGRVSGLFVGSVSQQVAMHAHCPVVVVRGADRPSQGPVVVGTDGSPESARALAFALRHAKSHGASVHAVHAEYIETPAGVPLGSWYGDLVDHAKQTTAKIRAAVDDAARAVPGVDVEFRLMHHHPVNALVEESQDARLVVVASRGLGGFAGLMLGSVSQGVLSRAPVPVAIVPHERTSAATSPSDGDEDRPNER